LLGGLFNSRIEAYGSDVYWEEDPAKMAENASRIAGLGFRTIKAHLGCESPKDDACRIQALRNAIGAGTGLMIDLNGGYGSLHAFQAAKLWERYDLTWLEEPVNPNQVNTLAELRQKTHIPIAAGENEFRTHGFKELFDKRALDLAMPDIGRVGGIQETKNICALADAYGIPVSPHNFSSGVLLAATIHLMASTPNTQFLEIDTSNNAVYEELLVEPLEIHGGFVTVPDHPGLGVTLRDDILDCYATH
jgi:L-alanine-DL-glutamate epimerase-like enolase superfamily enzyme